MAGRRAVVIKKPMGIKVSTRARGNRIKYAPRTPATAPLAPMVGTRESGLAIMWEILPADPASR